MSMMIQPQQLFHSGHCCWNVRSKELWRTGEHATSSDDINLESSVDGWHELFNIWRGCQVWGWSQHYMLGRGLLRTVHLQTPCFLHSALVFWNPSACSVTRVCLLQSLFMSADGGQAGHCPGSGQSLQHGQPPKGATTMPAANPRQEVEEEGCPEEGSRDCVVCQSAAVSVVLLPCRHACVCDGCVAHFQHCPICRAVILESFTLTGNQQAGCDHIT